MTRSLKILNFLKVIFLLPGMKYGVPESTVSVFSLLRLKGVFLITVCCIGIASTWISLDPTLEPHIEQVVREISGGFKGDARDEPPTRVQFLSFSCRFLEKCGQIVG